MPGRSRYPQELRERAAQMIGEIRPHYQTESAAISAVDGIGNRPVQNRTGHAPASWHGLAGVELATAEYIDWSDSATVGRGLRTAQIWTDHNHMRPWPARAGRSRSRKGI